MRLARKDGDYSGSNLPPGLALDGRITEIGSKLLGTVADALKPRVLAPSSVAVGADWTLMFEFGRDGESTGSYSLPVTRLYSNISGTIMVTYNAYFDGTLWHKDLDVGLASFMLVGGGALETGYKSGTGTWLPSAWVPLMFQIKSLDKTLFDTGHSIVLQGTSGRYKHGNRHKVIDMQPAAATTGSASFGADGDGAYGFIGTSSSVLWIPLSRYFSDNDQISQVVFGNNNTGGATHTYDLVAVDSLFGTTITPSTVSSNSNSVTLTLVPYTVTSGNVAYIKITMGAGACTFISANAQWSRV